MRITIRSFNKCLICNKNILFADMYECKFCKKYYHNYCIDDMLFINGRAKCLFCQKYIDLKFNNSYDIMKCLICELIPGILLVFIIIGIFVFFAT
jgi:hypothetical protein